MPTPTQIQPAPVKASPIPEQDVRDLLTPASRQKSLSKRLTGVVATLGWTALFLGLLDAGVNCLLAYPQDPLVTNPPKLPLYFEYGRSIEGKLDRMIGNSDETSAPLTQAGWIDDPKQLAALPTRAESENGTCVAAYGMSFTFRVSLQPVSLRAERSGQQLRPADDPSRLLAAAQTQCRGPVPHTGRFHE